MAGNNSFMNSLLDLLGDAEFFDEVADLQCSETYQVNVEDYLIFVEELLDLKVDQGQSNRTSFSLGKSPFSSTINELCCQITCEALSTNDARQTAELLFKKLSSFSWDAKAVLTLLALSVYYTENQHLAKNEQSDDKLGLAAFLRGRQAGEFEGLRDLIRVTWEFTRCAVEFANYSQDLKWTPVDKETAFYNIIVGVIGCSVAFCGMISVRDDFLGLDISAFLIRMRTTYDSFKKQVEDFKQEKDEKLQKKKIRDLYYGNDTVEFMAALFCTEDDLTVYHYSKKTKVKVEEFKGKSVMMLISNLNLSNDDLIMLTNIYRASRFDHSSYEIMWVPMVEIYHDKIEEQFQAMRSRMQWYACKSVVSKMAANFIRKTWKFSGRTQVVVLNQRLSVMNFDAMTMIDLWGINAFPFTEDRGNELWRSQVINWFELLLRDTVFPNVGESIEKGELILLYGSAEDSRTIKNIEVHLKAMGSLRNSFQICDIGNNRKKFRTRLGSYMSLKMQESLDVYDSRTKELVKLYTSYMQHGGFAILAKGSSVIINARLTHFEMVLSQYQLWRTKITSEKNVAVVLKDHYNELMGKSPCHHFYIPDMVGKIPESIRCAECYRYMKTAITFECCHGGHE